MHHAVCHCSASSVGKFGGSERFIKQLETIVGRLLRPQKPGRKRKDDGK